MKTAINIIILILFATTVSCKKTANFHVKIVNPATGEGYANTTFYVKSEKTGSDGEIIKTESTGVTNENGEAVVSSLKISNAKSYYVVPENIENVCYINDVKIYYTDRMTNPNPHFTFEIAPCAQLKLNIQNVNCEGPNDILNFKNRYNYTEWGSGWSTDRLGCYSWESPEYFEVPTGWRIYQWRVIRPSGTIVYTDSIYLNAGQNHTFEMIY